MVLAGGLHEKIPHRVFGLVQHVTPCEVVGKLPKMTTRERHEVCWHLGSNISIQKLISDVHWECWTEEPANLRAIQGPSSRAVNEKNNSHKKMEEG